MKNTILRSRFTSRLSIICTLLLSTALTLKAQQSHTAYFMKNSPISTKLNPAIQPDRGFISIPVLSLGVGYTSNGFSLNDILHQRDGKVVTFMDESVSSESFLSGLKNSNTLELDTHIDVLNLGWYSRKGSFWSAGLSINTSLGMRIPKSMLDFMKNGINSSQSFRFDDFGLNEQSYVEASVGYSRKVTSRITVGGRIKVIAGIADVDMKFDHIAATRSNDRWSMSSKGKMSASVKGLSYLYVKDADGKDYISEFDYDTFGISGWGGGVDLGVTYQLLDNLVLSASVLDLGLISWQKNATISGNIDGEYNFKGFDEDEPGSSAGDQFTDMGNNVMEMIHMQGSAPSGRTTSLRTTVNIGAEYSILNNILGFGLLSSTRFSQPKIYTELTASVNVRPCRWFSTSVSYSFIQSKFNTLGLALNFHPSFINFFVGSDYMVFNSKNGVPQFSRSANVYVGLAIPLGKRPN